uniref:Calcium binding protein 1 n=1 Tax=Meleagris gallopavo TaxID=9103 RepID=A0A803YIJ4_MELGA
MSSQPDETFPRRLGEAAAAAKLWSLQQIRHEEKTCYKAVQTSEEGPSEYQGPLMVLAQNCAVMHNLLGPACIFLRKGFAENRQPVRKLHPAGRDTH